MDAIYDKNIKEGRGYRGIKIREIKKV